MEAPDDIDIYYGVASGQQRSALSRLDPEGVMISHATARNTPIEGDYDFFVDSGGYHHMKVGSGEYTDSDEAYIEYLEEYQPDFYALRDYPCEPDLLDTIGRTVADQQERTVDHHIQMLEKLEDADLEGRAVTCVQGWTRQQYLEHLDAFHDHGIPVDHVAIGSVCRRGADEDIAEVILALRDELPSATHLHAFGVKGSVLRFAEIVEALDSVDSAAYDWSHSRLPDKRAGNDSFTWRDSARAYLNWRHELLMNLGSERFEAEGHVQSTLAADD